MPARPPTDYLHLFGLTALAYMWAQIVKVVRRRRSRGGDAALYAKLIARPLFFERVLPDAGAHLAKLKTGADVDGAAGGALRSVDRTPGRPVSLRREMGIMTTFTFETVDGSGAGQSCLALDKEGNPPRRYPTLSHNPPLPNVMYAIGTPVHGLWSDLRLARL